MTTSDHPLSINWNQYTKYCGTGVVVSKPYHYDDDPRSGGSTQRRPDPIGIDISLMPSYSDTPAMRAGLRTGDRITHALTTDGWIEVTMQNHHHLLTGPVGSSVELRIQPTDGRKPFATTIQKAWVLELYAPDPILRHPEAARLFAENLDRIPNRSKEDERCELYSSLEPAQLMNLSAPRFAAAAASSYIR